MSYESVLIEAVDALPDGRAAERLALYNKARAALVNRLRAIDPPLAARDITSERLKLEDAIRAVDRRVSDAVMAVLGAEVDRLRSVDVPPPSYYTSQLSPDLEARVFDGVAAALTVSTFDETLAEQARRLEQINDALSAPSSATAAAGAAMLQQLKGSGENATVEEAATLASTEGPEVATSPRPSSSSRRSNAPAVLAPAQDRRFTVFRVSHSGVEIDNVSIAEQLQDNSDQRLAYDGLRTEVASLLEGSRNLLGEAQRPLLDMQSALPPDIREARVFGLWRAGNRVRRLYRAHQAVAGQADGHPSALDPAVAEFVGAICDEFNNFAALDPGLRQRDRWRTHPQDLTNVAEEFGASNPLVDKILEANLASPEAAAAIAPAQLASELAIAPEVVIPEVDLVNQVRQNFVAAVIEGGFDKAKQLEAERPNELKRAARMIVDGLYSSMGGGTGYAALAFILLNSNSLLWFATNVLRSQEAAAIIQWIVRVFPIS